MLPAKVSLHLQLVKRVSHVSQGQCDWPDDLIEPQFDWTVPCQFFRENRVISCLVQLLVKFPLNLNWYVALDHSIRSTLELATIPCGCCSLGCAEVALSFCRILPRFSSSTYSVFSRMFWWALSEAPCCSSPTLQSPLHSEPVAGAIHAGSELLSSSADVDSRYETEYDHDVGQGWRSEQQYVFVFCRSLARICNRF